jgi:hypothetical protein
VDDRPELRYEDGPSTEADVLVDAPPDALWPFVTDIQLPSRFSDELAGAEWLDGATRAELGARFVGRNAHEAIGSWETVCTVSVLEPGATFEWTVGDPGHPSSVWRYTLRAEGTATRLGMWMRMGPASSGINTAIDAMPDKESRILYRRLSEHRANMERTLLGVKALAEGTA